MARPASPVAFIRPEIPTLVPEPPSGEGWIHEIKHDGYRTLIVIDGGKVRAFSRHGRDWTGPYRRVVEAAAKLSCHAALIDGEIIVQDENGISDFDALRSAIHKAPHRIVFFAFDLLHLDGQDLRRTQLVHRRAALRRLIEPNSTSPIQFSDHAYCDGALVFKHAAELGLEGIVSKRATSLYRAGPSKNWLKIKNMVEGEFVLLGTVIDDSGIPWALLAREQDGELEFAGPAIIRPPSHARAEWLEKFAAMAIDKPALKGLRRANKAQWFKPEIRVRAQHLKAKGTLRHATVKSFLGPGVDG
jgi:bifunctional non-homologous end joining protein LigD